jgi:hypothetical protein
MKLDFTHVKYVFLFQQFFPLLVLLNLAGDEVALFFELFLLFQLRYQDIGLLVDHSALLSFFAVFLHAFFDQLTFFFLESLFQFLTLLYLFALLSFALLELLFLHFSFLLLNFHLL